MIRVALCQFHTGGSVSAAEKQHLLGLRPDFIALPEYFFAPQEDGSHADLAGRLDESLEALARLSRETGAAVVGGTVVERRGRSLYNVCPVLDGGRLIARYAKRHPTPRERLAGIAAGDEAVVVTVRGVPIAPLVCADVLQPERFEEAGRLGARILFTPVVSPRRPDDTPATRERRDREIFLQGARRAGAFVVKTAAPGRVFGGPLQGRSLVAAPWGFLARALPGQEQDRLILVAELDPSRLPPLGPPGVPSATPGTDSGSLLTAGGPSGSPCSAGTAPPGSG